MCDAFTIGLMALAGLAGLTVLRLNLDSSPNADLVTDALTSILEPESGRKPSEQGNGQNGDIKSIFSFS